MLITKKSLFNATAIAALIGGMACAVPSFAQSDMAPTSSADQTQQAAPADQESGAPQTDDQSSAAPMHNGKHEHGMMEIETRIKSLHDKLKITPAQESDWQKVAQTMRDNEASMHQMIEERRQNKGSMTAVDDLQSYEKITQAHADGLQKLIAAFQTVYTDMSDSQKKNADRVFGHFQGKQHKHSHHTS